MKKFLTLLIATFIIILQYTCFPIKVYAGPSTSGGYICSMLNNYKVIDVCGGRTSDGTKIQLWELNRSSAQSFRFEKKGGYYAIVHVKSGKVLDVDGGQAQNGRRVILWSYHGGKNQLWRIEKRGTLYSFRSALGNYYLDVRGGNTANGTQIQIYRGNGTKSQYFRIQDDVTYTYKAYRLNFSTIDQWKRAMKASQQNAIGILSNYILDSKGSKTFTGGIITGCRVRSYKTITVRTQVGHNVGMYRNTRIRLPYEVEYTVHRHHFNRQVYFCVEDFKCVYTCNCGYHDVYSWTIPWPDTSDYQQIEVKPVFKEYHKNAFW